MGANLGATRANDFPRQANGFGQPDGDHASSRANPDGTERQAGIYGIRTLGVRVHPSAPRSQASLILRGAANGSISPSRDTVPTRKGSAPTSRTGKKWQIGSNTS